MTGLRLSCDRSGLSCDRFGLSCDRSGLRCDRFGLSCDRFEVKFGIFLVTIHERSLTHMFFNINTRFSSSRVLST